MKVIPAISIAAMLVLSGIAKADRSDTPREDSHALGSGTGTLDALRRHLQPFHVQVAYEGEAMVLRGTVDSEVERDLAATIASSVDNTHSLHNELKLRTRTQAQPPASPAVTSTGHSTSRFLQWMQDGVIAMQLRMRFLWLDFLSPTEMHVTVDQGLVMLSGRSTPAMSKMAERIARHTSGVSAVSNEIQVARAMDPKPPAAPKPPVSDGWIVAKVKSVLEYDDALGIQGLGVRSHQGRVTLTGSVPDAKTARRIVPRVQGLHGVRSVESRLDVQSGDPVEHTSLR